MIRMSRSISILGAALIMTIVGVTTAVVAYAAQNGAALGTTKVTLCHKGKNTITVGAPAQAAHMRHGDETGACDLAQPGAAPTTLETTMMTAPTTSETEIGEDANLADPATDTTNTEGTNQNDNTTLGTDSDDDLYGNSRANKLFGRHGHDFLDGGLGPDRMVAGAHSDRVYAADGKPDDVINGGIGTDYCVGDVGDEFRNCDGNVEKVPLPPEAAAPTEASN
jgi:Ca2+-binding RTX toxin-like protein